MRSVGLPTLLGDLLGPAVVVFALVTQLGDIWFLSLATVLPYWLGSATPRVGPAIDRRRVAIVVAILFGAIAILVTLKPLFGLARPPDAGVPPRPDLVPELLDGIYAWLSTGEGFGFPSGHALGSTVVFGGLAWAVRVGSRRQRIAVVAALVALVSLSRLVLGLHALVDVVAGAGIGLAYLAVVIRGLGTPKRAFGLATAVALAGLLVVGPLPEVVPTAGLCVGGTAAWLAVGDRLDAGHSRRQSYATALVGLVTAAPMLAVVSTVHLAPVLAVLGGLVGGVLVVALPLLGDAVGKKRR